MSLFGHYSFQVLIIGKSKKFFQSIKSTGFMISQALKKFFEQKLSKNENFGHKCLVRPLLTNTPEAAEVLVASV